MSDDRTQVVGGQSPTFMGIQRTQLGMPPPGSDAGRTVLGAAARTVEIDCVMGNTFAAANKTSREHALVVVKAGGMQLGRRAPINVALCVDRSGSMEGDPLEYAKRACEFVVDMLEPDDILSIVTFEERVEVLMPARRVVNKSLVKEHIQRIQSGNTTNLYDGIIAACSQVASVQQQANGYVSRVLVLTDGEPTAGVKDFHSIVGQVAEQKSRGISVTALGFGADYNEELMAGIARRTGGNYYYIQRPELLPEVFRRELETLMTIVARNVRLRFVLPRWVEIRQIYGQQPSWDGRTAEILLPDIERGTVRTVLVDLEFTSHPPAPFRVLRVDALYEDIGSGGLDRTSGDGVIEFTADAAKLAGGVNPMVQNELSIAQASGSLQRTMMGMRTQQLTAMGALGELEKTRNLLAQAGQDSKAREVTAAIMAIQRGDGDAEKTLVGTVYNLDQGKRE